MAVFNIATIIFALFLIGYVRAIAVLQVGKCKLEDSACMKDAFQKALPTFVEGIPEVGTEVLDPMEMNDLSFDLSGLQFSLKDGRMKGLKSTVFDRIKWDSKKKRIEVDYHMSGTIRGHYTAAGRILILPITGNGDMKLKLTNVIVKMYIDFKIEKGPNGDLVVPKKFDFTFEVKDNAHFSLTNLFNGNKELSDAMLKFLNENWKLVSQEFGRPMIQTAADKIYKNVATFFSKQILSDIAEV